MTFHLNNALIKSAIQFRNGDLKSSITGINAHFQHKFGSKLISEEELDLQFLGELGHFETLFEVLIQHYWNGAVSPGRAYSELWEHFPTSYFPQLITNFDFQVIGDFMSWEFQKAFRSLEMNLLIEILRDGVNSGCILSNWEVANGLLPQIGELFWDEVDRKLLVDDWAKALNDSIPRQKQEGWDLPTRKTCNAQFFVKYLLIQLFFHANQSKDWLEWQIQTISRGSTDERKMVLKSISNFSALDISEKGLTDFIHDYTCGRVLTENPRGWISDFQTSIETGSVSFDMSK